MSRLRNMQPEIRQHAKDYDNMDTFKGFLDALTRHLVRHDLFLAANKLELEAQMLALANQAASVGLDPIINKSMQRVVFLDGYAAFRIAHANLHRETDFGAFTWSAVHGLDTLDDFERGDEIKSKLLARVRP